MAVRPIDASRFGEILEQWKKDCLQDKDTQGADIISDVILQLDDMPTLPQPNEPLTLEEVTLMTEPTPVWWDWFQGWVLARKGRIISWNGVYYNFEEVKGNFYRRPPEEPLTCEGCVHEINEHENCNYCIRAGYLGDYYYRSQDVLKNE